MISHLVLIAPLPFPLAQLHPVPLRNEHAFLHQMDFGIYMMSNILFVL